jgi:hypothetical protein
MARDVPFELPNLRLKAFAKLHFAKKLRFLCRFNFFWQKRVLQKPSKAVFHIF